jgi:AcrR family transcriptional regulator
MRAAHVRIDKSRVENAMKTAERILDAALTLFNEQGVARTSTNVIADVAEISVGNLYYHFKNKNEILVSLLKRFLGVIQSSTRSEPQEYSLEYWVDWWHEWFDHVEGYRFLFHNQSHLLAENSHIRYEYNKLLKRIEAHQIAIFFSLKEQGDLVATDSDLHRIAKEVTFIAFFWLDFHDLQNQKSSSEALPFKSALNQVLGLMLPYLKANAQLRIEQLLKVS